MATEKEPIVEVKLLRATWEGETRKDPGEIVKVPLTAALWGIVDGLFLPAGDNPFKKD